MFRKFFTLFGTLGILAGGIFLIGVMASLRPKVEPEEPKITPPTVFFMEVAPQQVTLDVTAQGEVKPRTDITLTAQVSGRVVDTSSEFVNGGAFEEGDKLVKIEDAPYRAAAAAARARLAQEEAEATLARKDYEDLGREADPTALALRLPQLEQARAEYDAARLDLERTIIRAPFQGRVRDRTAGLGQFVSPGAPLARIFSTDVAEIRLALTDNDLAKLGMPIAFVETEESKGPPVYLSALIAGHRHEWQGRIARTDGAIDASTRQISAIAVVDDPYGAGSDDGTPLVIGLYVDAVIEGKPYDGAIVLPRASLYGRDIVYVIGQNNILSKRVVEVVSAERDTITVIAGLTAGERVVTSPLRGADEGDEVTPTDPSVLDSDTSEASPAIAAAGD